MGFLCLYLVYICTVLIGRSINQWNRRSRAMEALLAETASSSNNSGNENSGAQNDVSLFSPAAEEAMGKLVGDLPRTRSMQQVRQVKHK